MKKLLVAGATVAVLMATPSMAAEMPVKVKAAAPAPVTWNWSGLYFGPNLGYSWGTTAYTDAPGIFVLPAGNLANDPFAVSHSFNKVMGGGQVGARWQWGTWVVGAEGTFQYAGVDKSQGWCGTGVAPNCFAIAPLPFNPAFTLRSNTSLTNYYTATGSLGYAWGSSLVYAKGGWAGGSVRLFNSTFVTATGASACPGILQGCDDASARVHGWTAGAGWEYMLATTNFAKFSVGIEYDYVRLDMSNALGLPPVPNGSIGTLFTNYHTDMHSVFARANVTIDWCSMWHCSP